MTPTKSSPVPPAAPDPLPVPVVDNHAHLDMGRDGRPAAPIGDVLAAAAAVGVDRVIQIGVDVPAARYTVELVGAHPGLLGGIAVHPNEAPRLDAQGQLDAALAEIEALAAHPRIRVIGETGMDFYRTPPEGHAAQETSFRAHIEMAKRLGLTLQIHDRQAHSDVLRILDDAGAPDRTVMHCFSGDPSFAAECLGRGFYLSFAGTVTFANARGAREVLATTPADRVLVETDAPFLTPAPHRGSPNAPYLIPLTVRAMAGVRDESVPALCTAISATSEWLYGPW